MASKKKKSKKQKKSTKSKKSLQTVSVDALLQTFNHLNTLVTDLNNTPLTFGAHKFSQNELEIIEKLDKNESTSLNQLSELTNLNKTTIIREVNKLVHKNMIQKSREKKHPREVSVKLTKDGIELKKEVPAYLNELRQPVIKALSKMSEKELAYFNDAVTRLIDSLEQNTSN